MSHPFPDFKTLSRRIPEPRSQSSLEFIPGDAVCATKGALPDRGYPESERAQRFDIPGVPGPIRQYLGTPEIRIALRPLEARTFVAMPEAAIHEDCGAMLREIQIR